jgi:hypothetical protein
MNLKAHGSYSLDIKGDVLYFYATGPFNREAALDYKQELEKILPSLKLGWVRIIILFGESIFIPEAEEEMKLFFSRLLESRLKATAYVLGDPTTRGLIIKQVEDRYAAFNHPTSYHENLESAEAWIQELL